MATESDLRDLLRGPEPEGRAAIDLETVLTRARRRRRPKVVAAQVLGSVAVVGGLLTAVVVGVPPAQNEASLLVAEDTAGGEEFASMPESADAGAARILEACGDPVLDPAHLAARSLTTTSAEVSPAGDLATTLELAADEAVSGTVVLRSVVVARDGVVVAWGLPVDVEPRQVDLAPGVATPFDASFALQYCEEGAEALPAGEYLVRPTVAFFVDDADGLEDTVYGDPAPLSIRG